MKLHDKNGNTIEELSYYPQGRRRCPSIWQLLSSASNPSSLISRGYTQHEHLDTFGLININGRLYDPIGGRMLSPDNYLQDPSNTQSYNRYSYVMNNPLKYIDPKGNRWEFHMNYTGHWRDFTTGEHSYVIDRQWCEWSWVDETFIWSDWSEYRTDIPTISCPMMPNAPISYRSGGGGPLIRHDKLHERLSGLYNKDNYHDNWGSTEFFGNYFPDPCQATEWVRIRGQQLGVEIISVYSTKGSFVLPVAMWSFKNNCSYNENGQNFGYITPIRLSVLGLDKSDVLMICHYHYNDHEFSKEDYLIMDNYNCPVFNILPDGSIFGINPNWDSNSLPVNFNEFNIVYPPWEKVY